MKSRPTIEDLKAFLGRAEAKTAPSPAPSLATGRAAIDALLPGGGLPRGRVAEIAGPRSSGKTTLALAAAARATASGHLVAYVDASGELYPPSAAALGIDLARLLVVRPTGSLALAARAVEIVAQSRAFVLALLDLPGRQRLEERAMSRLRRAAHEAQVAIVVLAEQSGAAAHAAVRLQVAVLGAGATRRATVTVQKGGAAPPGTTAPLAGTFFPAEREAQLRAIVLAPAAAGSLR